MTTERGRIAARGRRWLAAALLLVGFFGRALPARAERALVVLGGGPGTHPLPEGQAMARWLRERGVAPQRILVERRARHTGENADFVVPLRARQRAAGDADHRPPPPCGARAFTSAPGAVQEQTLRRRQLRALRSRRAS